MIAFCPVIMIMGMAPRCAYAAPVARLSAPGPSVDMQTPGFPVSRPCVAAMKAAACSCRVRTSSIFELRSDSTTSRFSSPGTPKIRSTPSFSRAATRRSEPFGIGFHPWVRLVWCQFVSRRQSAPITAKWHGANTAEAARRASSPAPLCHLSRCADQPPRRHRLTQPGSLLVRERPRRRRTGRAAILTHHLERRLHARHVGAVLLLGANLLERRHDADQLVGALVVARLQRRVNGDRMRGPHIDQSRGEPPRTDRPQRRRPNLREPADPDDAGAATPDRFSEPQRCRARPLHAGNTLEGAQLLDRVETNAVVAQVEHERKAVAGFGNA